MKNFGELKNTFSEILVESILRKDDNLKSIVKQYIKLIKEDKAIRTQSIVYLNLEGASSNDEKYIDTYLTENIKILKTVNNHARNQANKKLEKILENKLVKNIKIDYPDKLRKLHENIHNLGSAEYDVDAIIENRNHIGGYILENVKRVPISENLVPTNLLTKLTIQKFNDKYQDLTEDEMKLVKTIHSSTVNEKADLLKEMTDECLVLINTRIEGSNDDVRGKLLDVKERLLESKFDEVEFTNDIIKLIDLKDSLTD